MKTNLPRAMVLVFEPRLGHSIWQDVIHNCRTLNGLVKRMKDGVKDGVKDGRYVAFRFITIHREEMGVVP